MKKVIFAAVLFCMAGFVKVQAQAAMEVHQTLNTTYADDDPVAMQQYLETHKLANYPGRTAAANNSANQTTAIVGAPAVNSPASTPPKAPAPSPAPAPVKKAVVARMPKPLHDTNNSGRREHRVFFASLFHRRNPNPCPQF